MYYKFGSSLKAGAAGEAKLHAMFPDWTRNDGRKADFTLPDGRTAELKTERRSTAQTPNIAVELYSSGTNRGAVQRALDLGITYIIYMFSDEKLFIYKPSELWQYVNSADHRLVKVPNKDYETTIMLVPRTAVAHLEVTID